MYRDDFCVKLPEIGSREVNICEFGAVSNTADLETARNNAKAVQRAIDETSANGGGVVNIPAGIWACVPIRLKSGVELRLAEQAVLKFVKSKEDYPLIITNYEGQDCIRTVSPISAENAENIAIIGDGVIDGGGDKWRPVKKFKVTEKQWESMLKISDNVITTKESQIWMPSKTSFDGNAKNIQGTDEEALAEAAEFYDFYRPVMISLRYCKNVLLSGVTFMNSPAWNIHPFFCESLTVERIKVKNPYHAQNGDGIDVESCTNVHIHHSQFETGDDAICIKSGKNAVARKISGPCSNIHIHDCTVFNGHGGFVVGSEMSRDVRDILVENCTFIGTDVGIRIKSALGRGGVVENITCRNINMTDIKNEAVIMTMGYVLNLLNRNESVAIDNEEDVPYFRNMTLEKLNIAGCGTKVKLEPVPDRDNTISNIVIEGTAHTGAYLEK
jgi:polygalacturonase